MTRLRAVVVCVGLLLTRIAVADEPPAAKGDNRARAQQLFDSALTDAEANNFAAACPKFLASQEADPKTSTLLNLGACYEKTGQSASAWGAFREAETMARRAGRADWEASARAKAEALEPTLVRLSIKVPSPVPGLVVTRDGAKISAGEWGVPIPIDPGSHVVTASAEGYESMTMQVDIGRESTTVDIPSLPAKQTVAPPEVVRSSPEPDREKTGWSTMKTTGAVVGIAGSLGLVASGVLTLVANNKYRSAEESCAAPPRGCSASAVSDADSAYGLAGAATATFIVGAIALGVGGALFLIAPNQTSRHAISAGGFRW